MKKIFSFEICLVFLVGMFLVLAITSPAKNPQKSSSDSNQNINSKGQVHAASTETITTYTEISPKEVFDLISKNDPNTILIDVSTAFKSGHIPKAINVPFKNIDKIAFGMDKNKTYIIYCRNNTDSLIALQKLVNAGFQKLFHLSGGYNNWVSAKYKTEK